MNHEECAGQLFGAFHLGGRSLGAIERNKKAALSHLSMEGKAGETTIT